LKCLILLIFFAEIVITLHYTFNFIFTFSKTELKKDYFLVILVCSRELVFTHSYSFHNFFNCIIINYLKIPLTKIQIFWSLKSNLSKIILNTFISYFYHFTVKIAKLLSFYLPVRLLLIWAENEINQSLILYLLCIYTI
jgi:hypothetical protein